jgi:PadR family transcriptional regulator PadR
MEHGIALETTLENLRMELRRGTLILAVLSDLRIEQYGYTLRKDLADQGVEIDEGTLYPLLRRLESQGLLVSHWREDAKRNKRFYRLSEQGRQVLARLLQDWHNINNALARIIERQESEPAALQPVSGQK